jgi:hypothetical protein
MAIGAMAGLALSYYLMFQTLKHETREDERRQNGDGT